MKKITIEFSDEISEAFDKCMKQAGRVFADATADILAKNPFLSDAAQSVQERSRSLDNWKRERGFGLNGKGVSRTLRRRNTSE